MRSLLLGALVSLVGLTACGDDTTDHVGARGPCAPGAPLAGCADAEADAEAACWRLVECGVYPVDAAEPDGLDWGVCMNDLGRDLDQRAMVIEQCISRSTCDELAVPGANNRPICFQYGDL